MSVLFSPMSFIIRGYSDDIDTSGTLDDLHYEQNRFVCHAQIIQSTAYISGALGELSSNDRKEIDRILLEQYNIHESVYRRSEPTIDI